MRPKAKIIKKDSIIDEIAASIVEGERPSIFLESTKTSFSVEAAQDLKDIHGIDVIAQIADEMSKTNDAYDSSFFKQSSESTSRLAREQAARRIQERYERMRAANDEIFERGIPNIRLPRDGSIKVTAGSPVFRPEVAPAPTPAPAPIVEEATEKTPTLGEFGKRKLML